MFRSLMLAFALVLVAQSGNASKVNGKISKIVGVAGDAWFVYFSVPAPTGNVPPCATQTVKDPGWGIRYTVKASTPGGKAMIASFLMAAAKGQQVWVAGAETCDVWPDTESIGHMAIDTLSK